MAGATYTLTIRHHQRQERMHSDTGPVQDKTPRSSRMAPEGPLMPDSDSPSPAYLHTCRDALAEGQAASHQL